MSNITIFGAYVKKAIKAEQKAVSLVQPEKVEIPANVLLFANKHIAGLEEQLAEANARISCLKQERIIVSYSEQELGNRLAILRKQHTNLQDRYDLLSAQHNNLAKKNVDNEAKLSCAENEHTSNKWLIREYERKLNNARQELTHLKSRGFWARLFNK